MSLFRIARLFVVAFVCVAVMMGVMMGVLTGLANYEMSQQTRFDKRFAFLEDQLPRLKELAYRNYTTIDRESRPDTVTSPKVAVYCALSNENHPWPLHRRAEAIDPLMNSIPAPWMPSPKHEVTTLVVLHWSQEYAGNYTDGTIGYRERCRVDIIDVATQARLASTELVGGDPPNSKREHDARRAIFGSSCDAAILKFVKERLSQ